MESNRGNGKEKTQVGILPKQRQWRASSLFQKIFDIYIIKTAVVFPKGIVNVSTSTAKKVS